MKEAQVQLISRMRMYNDYEIEEDGVQYGLLQRMDFSFATNAFEDDGIGMWAFVVNTRKMDLEDTARFVRTDARMALSNYATLFLADTWLPQTMMKTKVTIAFVDEGCFREFYSLVGNRKFNNHYSLMLVDVTGHRIVEEINLERIDGKKELTIMDLPDIVDDDEDTWRYDND
ncbi:MAG: hypothetical protein LUE86_04785 [Clostridiales bacterium]|nr:hypothetical protein [Clostridiales bacterium]